MSSGSVTVEVEEEKIKELYLAVSPNGNFAVELVLFKNEPDPKLKYKFRMYEIIIKSDQDDKDDHSDLNYNDSYSDRKFSHVSISKTFKFTENQYELITSENILGWSIAVSEKFNGQKPYKSVVRLLAISCISKDDMSPKGYTKKNGSKKEETKEDTKKRGTSGFTIVFTINKDNSIGEKVKEFNEYGGIVKLFSRDDKKPNMKEYGGIVKSVSRDDLDEKPNMKRIFLNILNVTGIYKNFILNPNVNKMIQRFKYPKRTYNALSYNRKMVAGFSMKYITRCLNQHYFLVDTTHEGARYMELYDLRTNQL
ncbi:7077_t:CDS:2, partial [Cetraspora pellucida]